MVMAKNEVTKYPNIPQRETGYTMEWIEEYLKDKATSKQIKAYVKEIDGKPLREQKKIFVSMFIKKEDEFSKKLLKIAKDKSAKEKKQ